MKIAQFALNIFLLSVPLQFGLHFWPEWAIVLGRKIDYLSPTLYFSDIVFIAVIAVLLKIKAMRPSQLVAIGLLLLPLLLINVYSSQWQITIFGWLRYVQVAVVGFLFSRKLLSTTVVVQIFACVALIVGTLALTQFFNQHSVGGLWYFGGERELSVQTPGVAKAALLGREVLRPYSLFSHPNTMAGFLVVMLPPLFWYVLNAKNPADYFLSRFGFVIALITIGLSLSRIAIAVATLFLVVALFQSRLKSIQKISLITCLGLFLIIFESTSGRLSQLFINDVSIVERSWLLSAATTMIKSRPLFGGGIGSFVPRVPQLEQPPFVLHPVHNILLLLLTEVGVVGSIYLFWLARTFVKQISNTPLFWSLVAIALTGMFDHYWLTQPQTRLLMGIIVGMSVSWSTARIITKSV